MALKNTTWAALLLCASCATPAVASPLSPLERYNKLVAAHPHLIAAPGDSKRGEIELILDPARIYAIESNMEARYRGALDAQTAHEASRVGVVMQDPYGILVREAVRFPNGSEGLYRRVISRISLDGGNSGAYCLPLLPDGRVVLLKEYRHQERGWRIGPPGGYREPGETAAMAAAREAREETGLTLGALTLLAHVDVEGEAIPIFVGSAAAAAAAATPDAGEALGGTVAWTLQELHQAILRGGYTDSSGQNYQLQGLLGSAYVLLAHHLASRTANDTQQKLP